VGRDDEKQLANTSTPPVAVNIGKQATATTQATPVLSTATTRQAAAESNAQSAATTKPSTTATTTTTTTTTATAAIPQYDELELTLQAQARQLRGLLQKLDPNTLVNQNGQTANETVEARRIGVLLTAFREAPTDKFHFIMRCLVDDTTATSHDNTHASATATTTSSSSSSNRQQSHAPTTTLSENALCALAQVFVTERLSFFQCKLFLEVCFTPCVALLTRSASRFLYSTVLRMAQLHPKPIVEGVLLQLLVNVKTQHPTAPQYEVMNRVVKERLTKPLALQLLAQLLQHYEDITWTDLTFKLVMNLFNLKLDVNTAMYPDLATHFVLACEYVLTIDKTERKTLKHTANLPDKNNKRKKATKTAIRKGKKGAAASLPFTTMILAFIQKYKPLATPVKEPLERITSQLTNFMKKRALSAVKKL
jgi:hypothetical protein